MKQIWKYMPDVMWTDLNSDVKMNEKPPPPIKMDAKTDEKEAWNWFETIFHEQMWNWYENRQGTRYNNWYKTKCKLNGKQMSTYVKGAKTNETKLNPDAI